MNVASNAAFFPIPHDFDAIIRSGYVASKAAVIRFGEALAAQLRETRVGVFTISPGTVKTPMTAEAFADVWGDPDLWSPPELTAELVHAIASGGQLSGRYIHAAADDWRTLNEHAPHILAHDLNALRLRGSPDGRKHANTWSPALLPGRPSD